MATINQHEVKGSLAKLLATENISIQHNPNAKTAWFDVKKRVLSLPVWEGISEDLYDMLVVHEVGHALDTPVDGWENAIKNIASKFEDQPSVNLLSNVKDYLNIIEDARIDKKQKRRYPGSKRNYVIGYKELHARDFFGAKNFTLESLPLIDRINLYYKPNGNIIPFNAEERAFINRIDNAETFDDVVQITSDLFSYSADKSSVQQYFDESEESEEFFDEEFDDSDDSDHGGNSWDDEEESNSDDSDDSDASDEESGEEAENKENDKKQDANNTKNAPASQTQAAARKSEQTLVKNDNTDYVYCKIPKFNLETIVDDYKIVVQDMYYDRCFSQQGFEQAMGPFAEWKRSENDAVSFMVKEFEMKKAADMHSRIRTAKTGVIDTNKIHSYQYNDDIFRRMSTVAEGKNHGFFVILDWSGSMTDNIADTMKQLFSITMFCKRVGIPFEVYLFRTWSAFDTNKPSGYFRSQQTENPGEIKFDRFKLRNILSSRMNLDTLNRAYKVLWYLATQQRYFNCDSMNSTPLNQAILASEELINNFKKSNKLQIVNTVILTDGASDSCLDVIGFNPYTPGSYAKKHLFIISDDKTKISMTSEASPKWSQGKETRFFVEVLKARTGCNILGFYLYSGRLCDLSSSPMFSSDYKYFCAENTKTKWSNDNFVPVSSVGFDEFYVVKSKKNEGTEFVVTGQMNKNNIAKAFIKVSNKKKSNRNLLRRFIDRAVTEFKKTA